MFIGTWEQSTDQRISSMRMVKLQIRTDDCPVKFGPVTTGSWLAMSGMVASAIIMILKTTGSPQSMSGNIALACMLVTRMKFTGHILRRVLAALPINGRPRSMMEFCRFGQGGGVDEVDLLADLPGRVGVQAQVFTIINDEDYYYPDLMRGMIIDGEHGADMAHYTGSTTGTTRNNEICSSYTPITWQVDRKCHLISASSFDKMCADMKLQRDDMSDDLHAHGAREVVSPEFAANNIANSNPESVVNR